MATIEFFKQQSKNFMKDYKTRAFNEAEGFYIRRLKDTKKKYYD